MSKVIGLQFSNKSKPSDSKESKKDNSNKDKDDTK